jgi:hypothetical protein
LIQGARNRTYGQGQLIRAGGSADTSHMAAAAELGASAQLESVSPELVLVDPRLAVGARALLSDPEDTLARLGQGFPGSQAEPPLLAWKVDPASSADEEVGAALRRITELSEVEPPQRRRRRLVGVVSLMAAWSAVAVFVADLQLGLYEWPAWPF